jgi:hypothetical protein
LQQTFSSIHKSLLITSHMMLLAMQSPAFTHHHDRTSSGMTTEVVMPTPSCLQSTGTLRPSRPKLSLNTTQVNHHRTFGKGSSSSLRLETLSAVSPTVRNTFSNTYEPAKQPATPGSNLTRPTLSIDIAAGSHSDSKSPDQTSSRTPSSSSISSASTFSEPTIVPYKPSHGIRSILTNSPLPRSGARRMSVQRPMFPAQKHVSFKAELVEEIKTSKFTLAHSDLYSLDVDSTATVVMEPTSEGPPPSENAGIAPPSDSSSPQLQLQLPTNCFAPNAPLSRTRSPTSPGKYRRKLHRLGTDLSISQQSPSSTPTGSKRDSSSDEDSDDSCPETPVAGRRKRQRDWTWTLGRLPGYTTSDAGSDSESLPTTVESDSHEMWSETITAEDVPMAPISDVLHE